MEALRKKKAAAEAKKQADFEAKQKAGEEAQKARLEAIAKPKGILLSTYARMGSHPWVLAYWLTHLVL